MAKQKRYPKTKSPSAVSDPYDGIFALKLVVLVVVGSIWLKITNGDSVTFGAPIGLIVGIVMVRHERFRTDRKIGYAVLALAMLIGFMSPYGIIVNV